MSCLTPIWLNETSERFGQYVPCGKCAACLEGRRAVWTFRMMKENQEATTGYFITLTYDEDNLPMIDQWNWTVATLYKKDLQDFFKRLRANLMKYGIVTETKFFKKLKSGKWAPKIRYFACGEYGKKGDRPHYHIILWNFPDYFVDYDPICKKKYSDLIDETWSKGIVDIGEVEQASCHYVAKYTLDSLQNTWRDSDFRERPFAVMSRKPGIGLNYANDEKIKNHFISSKVNYALIEGNFKQPLGRYLKEKIFSDDVKALREVGRRSREYAIKRKEKEEEILKGYREGDSAERSYLQAKREQRKNADRKVKRNLKNNKL